MNRLMGIKKDKEISGVDCAMEEEVDEFEEGTTTAPKICPMHPYLNSTQHTSWNDALCEMFVEHFEKEEGVELTPDNKGMREDDVQLWVTEEERIAKVAHVIKLHYGIPGKLPPKPSSFHFDHAHKSHPIAKPLLALGGVSLRKTHF